MRRKGIQSGTMLLREVRGADRITDRGHHPAHPVMYRRHILYSMRILLFHDFYQQPGGEDAMFLAERSLLRRNGHTVIEFVEDNDRIPSIHPLGLAVQTIWSRTAYDRVSRILRDQQPDVAYGINTFPLISPSVYYACRKYSVPVVQGLHNYRLLCPAASFFRAGRVCTDCLGKTPPWPGVWHHCFRNSTFPTIVVAVLLTLHRWMRTWSEKVNRYIAPTEFLRGKYLEGGFPADRIAVKPNFILQDPGVREGTGEYALYVGRLSPEKGVRTLVDAWKHLKEIPLKIVGSGPLQMELQSILSTNHITHVEMPGRVPREDIPPLMKKARFLVFPSICFESFGMSIVESYSCGVPVIASRLGAMAELVRDGRTGLLFAPGDTGELAEKAQWAWNHPEEMAMMGLAARREYENKYTSEHNHRLHIQIFQHALESRTTGTNKQAADA
jgi:glycosyltransferase involved in cell wall biosynthesis